MTAHFVGGDIKVDYPLRDVAAFMEEMGLRGDEEDVPPLEDARWQTVMGEEVLLDVLEYKLASGIDSDNSDGDT